MNPSPGKNGVTDLVTENENGLIAHLDEKLKPFSFEKMDLPPSPAIPPVLAAWKRKTWNTNRAVVMIRLEDPGEDPSKFLQSQKFAVGKRIGYTPFFYPLGLQIILVGHLTGNLEHLKKVLDRVDNQRVNLQSIHLVDLEMRKSYSVRTWAQIITGRFQDAIEEGIESFLKLK